MRIIDLDLITNGQMDGQKVWICDFRYTDFNNKPIRHIKPMEVLIRRNSETTRNIYYSESHFVGLNKKTGEPLKSKVISLFDNTGFRSRTGTPVAVFDNKLDCVEHYKDLCKGVLKSMRIHKLNIMTQIDCMMDDIKKDMENI